MQREASLRERGRGGTCAAEALDSLGVASMPGPLVEGPGGPAIGVSSIRVRHAAGSNTQSNASLGQVDIPTVNDETGDETAR